MALIPDEEGREFQSMIEAHRRRVTEEQVRKFEGSVAESFIACGLQR